MDVGTSITHLRQLVALNAGDPALLDREPSALAEVSRPASAFCVAWRVTGGVEQAGPAGGPSSPWPTLPTCTTGTIQLAFAEPGRAGLAEVVLGRLATRWNGTPRRARWLRACLPNLAAIRLRPERHG